jgi:TolB-like protein
MATMGPSVAVLPFRNLSGDPREDYFGEGITEDIVAGLARNRSLVVISRSSTLAYRSRAVDARQIARDLGVRDLVDGSVRRHRSTLRISAELNDAIDNRTVWAERFQGEDADLFDFQDRIASSVVGTIHPRIQEAEVSRARAKPTASLDAYDCVLRALSLLYTLELEDFFEAGSYIDRAVQLDASFAQAYAYRAWWYVLLFGEGRADNPKRDAALAEAAAQRALDLAPDDALVLAIGGHVRAFLGAAPEPASHLFDRAIHVDPSSAFAWGISGSTCSFLGDGDEALRRLGQAHRLSPFDPLKFFFWTIAGLACFVQGRDDESVEWLLKAQRANPRFLAMRRLLAASAALAGRQAQATEAARLVLQSDPAFSIRQFLSWYPLQRRTDRDRLAAGLRQAGLPE